MGEETRMKNSHGSLATEFLDDNSDRTTLFHVGALASENRDRKAVLVRYLVIVEGNEVGRRLELASSPLAIGRNADCPLSLQDPCVSKQHAVVALEGDAVWITDLNSTNGAFLDECRIVGKVHWPEGKSLKLGSHVLRHEVRHRHEVEASERLAEDLRKARAYVQSLLPAPLLDGAVRVEWCFAPSAVLGGDCFGYHWLDRDRLAFYLVDICGHGVGPAMHSVSVVNLLRNETLGGVDFSQPSEVLRRLNQALPMEQHGDMFFSIWYGVYRRSDRRLAYASGGHPPALLLSPKGSEIRELHTPSPFVGMFPGPAYPEHVETIEPGGALLVFSDGAFEIRTQEGKEWSFKEFRQMVASHGEPANLEANGIYSRVVALAKEGRLDDDFSLMLLRFD